MDAPQKPEPRPATWGVDSFDDYPDAPESDKH